MLLFMIIIKLEVFVHTAKCIVTVSIDLPDRCSSIV